MHNLHDMKINEIFLHEYLVSHSLLSSFLLWFNYAFGVILYLLY